MGAFLSSLMQDYRCSMRLVCALAMLVFAGCDGASEPNPAAGDGEIGSDASETSSFDDADAPDTQRADVADTSDASDTSIPGTRFVYVGRDDGTIATYDFDATSGALTLKSTVAAGSMPSFLAIDSTGRRLYAVNEGSSQVAAFSISPSDGSLVFQNRISSGGGGPAWVSVSGAWVFAANYGGGNVAVLSTKSDGSLDKVVTPLATGTNPHAFVLDVSSAFAFVPNKGSDTVSQLRFDAKTGALSKNSVPTLATAKGAGPRHLAFHPSGKLAYLMNELDSTMQALAFDATTGTLSSLQTISTLPTGFDPTKNTGAEVAVAPSGKFAYGSNRGHDSIVIFAIDVTNGKLTLVGHEPTGGKTPRHFSIDASGETLLVGNQGSGTVSAFRIDATSGKLMKLATTGIGASPYFVAPFVIPKG